MGLAQRLLYGEYQQVKKKKQRIKRDRLREATLDVKFSKSPTVVNGVKTWYGNKGLYRVTESAADSYFHASVQKTRRNGTHWYDYVEEHVRFRNLITAMLACNYHFKDQQQCPSTNTRAPAATKSKNSKTVRSILESALSAASPTDSSDNSPKSESPRLEALLSHSTRGVSVKAEGTKVVTDADKGITGPLTGPDLRRLGEVLQLTRHSIESGMNMVGLSVDAYEPSEVALQLLNISVEACQGCDYWHDSCELVDDDNAPGFCYECRSNMRHG